MSIKKFAESNNGYIKTSNVENMGFSRPMLSKYTNEGKLERISKGLYVLSDNVSDEYALLQDETEFGGTKS